MGEKSEAWEGLSNGFRSGMENIQDQLLQALRKSGVERYGKVGEPFDHALHEAVEERDDVAGGSNTIVRILRYGYKKGDQILRPAQVVIKP